MTDVTLPEALLPPHLSLYRTVERAKMRICYAFFHNTYGSLGRIYFTPVFGNQIHIQCEVSGSDGAPMTETRKKLITQLSQLMPSQLDRIFGKGDGIPPAVMRREKISLKTNYWYVTLVMPR